MKKKKERKADDQKEVNMYIEDIETQQDVKNRTAKN
jgi:hypothetical protein